MLGGQVEAWRRAEEIREFCSAVRARADGGSPSAEELGWLRWAKAYAARIDPLGSALRMPSDPPANRRSLRDHLKGDLYAHPWPFDNHGRWKLPGEGSARR